MLSNDGRGDTQGAAAAGLLKVKNVFFAGMDILGADVDKKNPSDWSGTISSTYFSRPELNNQEFADIADLELDINWGPLADSPLRANGAADWSDAFLNGFEQVPYAGAFKSNAPADDWTSGWANFDPRNTAY